MLSYNVEMLTDVETCGLPILVCPLAHSFIFLVQKLRHNVEMLRHGVCQYWFAHLRISKKEMSALMPTDTHRSDNR